MGTFSSIPHGIMSTEDTRLYIQVKYKDYDHSKLIDIWCNVLIGDEFLIKQEYSNVVEKRLDRWNNFPNFSYDEKCVKLVLSRIHNKFLWTNRPHLITKEAISEINGLWDKGIVPMLKYLKNEVVMEPTRETYDKRALAMKTITNQAVKYTTMMMRHKIYFRNRENFVLAIAIYTGFDMVVKDAYYDLCELL